MMKKMLKFMPNRVWRVYLGGSGIDALRNAANPADGHFPEDWIASASLANNPQYDAPDQGLSQVELAGKTVFFRDLLREEPEWMLGPEHLAQYGTNPLLLMKILDAAEQLPIQAHPSIPNAKRFYHSDFGKTEAWYVVAVREVNGEKPYLLFGFNDRLDPATFRKESLEGRYTEGAKMLNHLEVRPGDRFIVPGGTAHAIGSGVTLIEVMEPSDLVIQPELYCGTQRISDSERWSGASPEDALSCFDYIAETEAEVRKRCSPAPVRIDDNLERVIPYEAAHCFEVQHLSVNGSYSFLNREKRHRAGVVIRGSVTIRTCDEVLNLKQGDAFFFAYAMEDCEFSGDGEVIFALPPQLGSVGRL